ncbi:MAG: class I SAM-dependent methyltransferase [Planctomycetota bacterium]
MENISLDHICRHMARDESGIWHSQQSEECHYPEDGAQRLSCLEEDSFWFIHRRNCILGMMKRFPPESLIIDVGGGNGFVTLGLKNAGFSAVLLEPSVTAVMNAYQRGVDQIICSTVDHARFDPHSIPAIGIFDVLEHIEDDRSFIIKLRDILTPGGKLYLTVPAFQCLWSLQDQYAEHFRRYRLNALCSQLDKCGFVVDYATYLFSYLALPLFLVKVIPTKLGLAKICTHEQTRHEHVIQPGLKKKALDAIHAWEQRRIRKGNVIPLGTSVMISAHVK